MILRPVRRFLERRRFPTLLLIAVALLAINIVVPDPLPFVDEILMLIATLIIAGFRKPRETEKA